MPLQVTCPSCTVAFKASDAAAGKQAKCPKCNGLIDIPAAVSAAVPADDVLDAEVVSPALDANQYEVEPPLSVPTDDTLKPCPMCGEMISSKAVKCRYCGEVFDKSMVGILGGAADVRDPGWQTVRNGLATVYYCIIVILIAVILMVVAAVILGGMGQQKGDPPIAMIVVFVLFWIVVLGAGIGSLVCYILCAFVPVVSGARKYVIGSLLCGLANFLLSVIGGATGIQAVSSVGSLFSIGSWVMFVLFIRHSATYLGNHDLATSAIRFIYFGIALFVGAFAFGVAMALAQAPVLLGILGLLAIVAALVALVWYLRLIQGLKSTIDQRTGIHDVLGKTALEYSVAGSK